MAEDLWDRSVDRHGFHYTTILSDGDAKTFKRLSEMEVYGPDVKIEKEEWVNHVANRMKTALLKLATEGKKRGVVLGGQGHGKLTAQQSRHWLATMTMPSRATAGTWKACGKPSLHPSSMPSRQMRTRTTPAAQRGPPAGASTRRHWPKGRNRAAIVRTSTQPCHGKLPATSRMCTCA